MVSSMEFTRIFASWRCAITIYNYTVDALLICGDFEAVRNHQDLECMSAPKIYKKMVDFHK